MITSYVMVKYSSIEARLKQEHDKKEEMYNFGSQWHTRWLPLSSGEVGAEPWDAVAVEWGKGGHGGALLPSEEERGGGGILLGE